MMLVQYGFLVLCAAFSLPAHAQLTPADLASGQLDCTASRIKHHNPGIALNTDGEVCFEAYISSFDTSQKLDRQTARFVGIPHWVVQRVDEITNGVGEGRKRPRQWLTIPALQAQGKAPTHASYHFSRGHLAAKKNKNWYERGHLAQKYLAERLQDPSDDAKKGPGWFTHNVANAVPQRARLNKGPWLTLECYTGAWANRYHTVWIVSGPLFDEETPTDWLKSDINKKALPVAIPNALFKIVAKKEEGSDGWEMLAFIYPQDDPSYEKGPWDPSTRLDTVQQIEKLTDQQFFPDLPVDQQHLKREAAAELWPVERDDFDPSCKRFAPKEP